MTIIYILSLGIVFVILREISERIDQVAPEVSSKELSMDLTCMNCGTKFKSIRQRDMSFPTHCLKHDYESTVLIDNGLVPRT